MSRKNILPIRILEASSLPKVALIHLGPSPGTSLPSIYFCYPPLNILSLAAYLKRQNSGLEPLILDGNLLSFQEILRQLDKFKPEIIGLSPILYNYREALKIARRAKSWNATVIVGGHYATHLAKEIISNRGPHSRDHCVDAVCRFDGEKAFYEIVKKRPFDRIDNLVFQDKQRIKFNRSFQLDLNKLPLSSELLACVDIRRYYRRQKELNKSGKGLAVYAAKGCAWRSKVGGCVFCSVMDKNLRKRNVRELVVDLEIIDKNYRPDFIYECSDSFPDDFSWLEDFCSLFSRSFCRASLTFYARPDQIVRKNVIKALSKIKIARIILGVESGDDYISSKIKKGFTPRISEEAVKIINNVLGIPAICNFVIGLPGENIRSLRNTLNLAQKIKKRNDKNFMDVSICTPRPGSLIFPEFIKRTGNKYLGLDWIPREEMLREWISNFCSATYEEVIKFWTEMSNL